jgi:hypothetical protein
MRRPWIGRKDFHNFHWTKKTSSRRRFWGVFLKGDFSREEEEKDDES